MALFLVLLWATKSTRAGVMEFSNELSNSGIAESAADMDDFYEDSSEVCLLQLRTNATARRYGGGGSVERGGFKCPGKNICNGKCKEDGPGSWQEWLDAHNVRRCMHDVPAVVWSTAMYEHVHKTFKNQQQMKHSPSYQVPPPAGPAGENLAWASYVLSPEQSTGMWYDEIKDCGPFPGCSDGATGVVGHFTALIWDGVREIGCHSNKHRLVACQYRAGDRLGSDTPNMMGHYRGNVFSNVKSRSQCEKILKKCKEAGGGGAKVPDDGDGAFGGKPGKKKGKKGKRGKKGKNGKKGKKKKNSKKKR